LATPALGALKGVGTTSANFLKIGVGARPVALAEAYTALAEDVNAVYYNPAGLGFLQRQEVTLMHNKFFEGVAQEWAAYALPTNKRGTFGFGFQMLRIKPFDSYDEFDRPTGQVSAADMAVTLAYGKEIGKDRRWAWGGSAKYIHSRLSNYNATAVAADFGAMLRGPEDKWRYGVAVRNLGRGLKFIEQRFDLPATLRGGLSYHTPLDYPFSGSYLTWTTEAIFDIERNPSGALGVEFSPVKEMTVRVGWRQNQDAGLGVSAGVGFSSLEAGFIDKYSWWPEFLIDYAFVDFGPLEHTHRVSVTIRFGGYKGNTFDRKDRVKHELKLW
jgi:hypothetical protein